MFDTHFTQCKALLEQENTLDRKLESVCEYLLKYIEVYDWVGFYFANQETKTLHLKAFAGEPSEHTSIPFGKGICGQVSINNESMVIDDVSQETNYIACHIAVKSEIVVPIFKNNENIGQIDIDSNTLKAFSEEDKNFLTRITNLISEIID